MSSAGAAHLKANLEDNIADFFAFERMTTEISPIIRAVYKELLTPGGGLCQGQGTPSLSPG
eukprot:2036730-Pleurochrysis_carterae.AAC.1